MHEVLHVSRPAATREALDRAVHLLDDATPLAHGIVTADPSDPALLNRVVAWLACGRAHHVRALLRGVADRAGPDSVQDPPTPVLPAVVARYAAWTGDLGTTAAVWSVVRDAVAAIDTTEGADAATDQHAVAVAAALAGIERTAADMGDPQLAARCHPRARAARAHIARLQPGPARRLAYALGLTEPPAFPLLHPVIRDDVAAAADLVIHLAHSILGLEPDAPRHRLWLRLRPPTATASFAAGGIRVGDDIVSVAMEVEPGRLRVAIEQDAGAIPITALLEPFVPGRLLHARVDGTAADLGPRPSGPGTVLPVQLVLDHARTLEIAFADEDGSDGLGLDAEKPPG